MTTTFRADEGLAFLLQYENVAWYDAGEVRILDRRVYPAKTEFVTCRTHGEVAQAIRDMVTQSAGPYTAAAMGMALAAYECREKTEAEQLAAIDREFGADTPQAALWRCILRNGIPLSGASSPYAHPSMSLRGGILCSKIATFFSDADFT